MNTPLDFIHQERKEALFASACGYRSHDRDDSYRFFQGKVMGTVNASTRINILIKINLIRNTFSVLMHQYCAAHYYVVSLFFRLYGKHLIFI